MTMGIRVIGFVLCSISFLCVAVSIGIPYWTVKTVQGFAEENSGLWQYCLTYMGSIQCRFLDFGDTLKFDILRGLEVGGCFFGFWGTMIACKVACGCRKSKVVTIIATATEVLAGALVIAGFILHATDKDNDLKNAHAGFYLNIIGGAGLGIGGILLLWTMKKKNSVSEACC